MIRILLVDDDAPLLDVLSLAFEDAGYEVVTARDGNAALRAIEEHPPGLMVSDVNMPGLDGFSLCKKLRERQVALPIVLLTSRDGEIDEALGLDLGADDYVAKPFSTRVLMARVAALLRRQQLLQVGSAGAKAPADGAAPIACGELELLPDRLEARFAGQLLTVTVTEFHLLEAFATRPGQVLSRDRLLEVARGEPSIVDARIIDTYVRRLRRKLEAISPAFDHIETKIGAGYRWRL